MRAKPARAFDIRAILDAAGVHEKILKYRRADDIFAQGEVCNTVMYVQSGGVKLSVRSKTGKDVVVAVLGPGEFFGEGCMAGQPRRMGSATAAMVSSIIVLKKTEMLRLLHQQPDLSERFIIHLLGANIRIEEDLIDQLFTHEEKRLARTLLLLARYGREHQPASVLPRMTQARLAQIAGTSRSSVGFFLKKFKRLGFIDPGPALTINSSLLGVILHE